MHANVNEVVARIQQLVVKVLDLPIPAEGVDAEEPLGAMEIRFEGQTYEFDSVDLVEVLSTLEDELAVDLLEDPAVTEILASGSLRAFADYLASETDGTRLKRFCHAGHPEVIATGS